MTSLPPRRPAEDVCPKKSWDKSIHTRCRRSSQCRFAMKNLLFLQALAGGAVAQHMTLPVIDNAAIVAAVNPTDQGFKVCSAINEKLQGCASQVGGVDGLTTAAPSALAQCACCDSGSRIAGAYSACSSYLAEEAPTLSTQYSGWCSCVRAWQS